MFYRQSIIIFGFVLPAAVCAIIVGGGIVLKSKATASFEEKQALYKSSEQSRAGSQNIEKEISQKRGFVEHWNSQLERETANAISSALKEIGDKLPAKEFQQTAVEYPNGAAGFAAASAQSSSQVRLAFRATYRSMQRAFLELETLMPQLQMQELKIDPNSSTSSMNFSVTYTAWEK
ncbi:hypothetical protein [Haloferula sp. BvORR071]|uniref:hypothetical protein n=1 Tax=Haloferula sp. BvORR071 TaxID=1396141 RepID=UPI000557DFB5|nr:hypothetical protein [Haloferula sp. BvORR071]